MTSPDTPAAPPPVALWHDARLRTPPPFREVVVITADALMRFTAYWSPRGWRLVGRGDITPAVTWWCDCIPTPLPDARHERTRLAAELGGARP